MKKALITMFSLGLFVLAFGGFSKAHAGWYTDYSNPAWYNGSSYGCNSLCGGYSTNYNTYNNYNTITYNPYMNNSCGSCSNTSMYSYNNSYGYNTGYNGGYMNNCSCIQAVGCPCGSTGGYGVTGYGNTGYGNSYTAIPSYQPIYNTQPVVYQQSIPITNSTYPGSYYGSSYPSYNSYNPYNQYGYGNNTGLGIYAGVGLSFSW